MLKRATAVTILTVALLAISVGTVAAVPDGFVGLPHNSVDAVDGLPVGTPIDAPGDVTSVLPDHVPTEASTWSVQASEGASTLSVTIAGHEREPVALVLEDGQNHAGREVAVRIEALEQSLGQRPATAFGIHESGDPWASRIDYRDGYAVFDVPKFSQNTVTFEGEVEITASPATDGDQFSYDLTDVDSASNVTATIEGSTSTAWDNESAAGLGSGGSFAISPAGNLAPAGPSAAGNPTLNLTAYSHSWQQYTGTTGSQIMLDGAANREATVENISGVVNISSLTYYQSGQNGDPTVDVYAVGERADGVYKEGTLVNASYTATGGNGAYHTIEFDTPFDPNGATDVTFEFVGTSGSGTKSVAYTRTNAGTYSNSGTVSDHDLAIEAESNPKNVNASSDDGATAVFGDMTDGGTAEQELAVGTTASAVSISADGGSFDATLELRERTQTQNVTLEVNNGSVNHPSSLADGDTTTLDASDSWIQNGTNRVNVSVAPSLSADAPIPSVGLVYNHSAAHKLLTNYSAGEWIEDYNVSRTFASSRSSASLSIPFSSNVVEIGSAEQRRNGSSWSSVPDSNITTGNETTDVDLGSVDAGETVEVRVEGRRVQTINGEINVLDPTLSGDLDTRIEVRNPSAGFRIDVSGTSSLTHYLGSTTWVEDAYAAVDANGGQTLYLPSAGHGDEARVKTIPVEVSPTTGDVEVVVEDASKPEFTIRPGGNAAEKVEVGYHDTVSGERYGLYRSSNDEEIDAAVAQSPVWLTTSDDEETYYIAIGSGSGSGEVVASVPVGSADSGPAWWLVLGLASAAITAFWGVSRRFEGDRSRQDNALLVAGSVVVGALGLELLTPGSLVDAIVSGSVASTAGTIVLGIGLLVGLWLLDVRTEREIPRWILGVAGVVVSIWMVEALRPGSLLGPLQESLAEVGPLVWLALIGGGGFLAWRAIKASRQPDTRVTFKLGEK